MIRLGSSAATLSLCGLLLLLSGTLHAQVGGPATGTTVELPSSRKDPLVAGVLEWVLPTAGYAYAGNWKKGVAPGVLRYGGAVVVLLAIPFMDGSSSVTCNAQCITGAAMAITGVVWGTAGSVNTAKGHNARVSGSASFLPTPSGTGLSSTAHSELEELDRASARTAAPISLPAPGSSW
jgi:hypothetical protein